METGLALPTELAEQIERILADLGRSAGAECVLLADASGQLISVQGQTREIDPALMAVLGAADLVATSELVRQIGRKDTGGALLREGRRVNVYLFDVASRFVLIVVFRAGAPANLVQLYGGRAVEQLRPLAAELEDWINRSLKTADAGFDVSLAEEMGVTFETVKTVEKTTVKPERDHRFAAKCFATKWRKFYLDARQRSRKIFGEMVKRLQCTTSAPEQQSQRSGEPDAVTSVAGGNDDAGTDYTWRAKLAEQMKQIEYILVNLRDLTQAQCVMLADSGGQLISVHGQTQEIDPVLIAVLGAADVMATAELIRQIGGQVHESALFRQGKHANIYLFDVAGRFVLIVISRADTLAGMVHTFGKRAVERLRPLTAEFDDWMNEPTQVSGGEFGAILAEEMDRVFEGL